MTHLDYKGTMYQKLSYRIQVKLLCRLWPPRNTQREIVSLNPDFAVKWSPTFTGKYWNDGMYHFFPKKTKLSAEFTNKDFIDNLVSMGAKNET